MRKLILLIGVYIAIPIAFWARTLTPGLPLAVYLYDAGRFLALVGFVLILFQYVLSSRIRLIERGIGLDRLFSIHRKLGVAGLTFIFVHPIALFTSAKVQGYDEPLSPLKILGIFALLVLCMAAGVAILYRRLHLKYETWKNIHRASYVIFGLGFAHSFLLGSDIQSLPLRVFWIVLACIYVAVLVYKVGNWACVRSCPFEVSRVSKETHDTWSLYFEGKYLNYRPGQFMIVRLIRDEKVSEPHPFTISSSPIQDRLSISVKSVGDFTSTIGDTKISDGAYIDAPYGVFSFFNYDARDLIFIAGGIGITPFMSMLRYIYDRKLERNITLIWGNKTEEDIVFKDELEKMAADLPWLKVVHVMSKQDNWQGEKGYVDAEKLKKYVSNFQEGEFFICGPPLMMTMVQRTLRDLGVSKKRIHYERFALR